MKKVDMAAIWGGRIRGRCPGPSYPGIGTCTSCEEPPKPSDARLVETSQKFWEDRGCQALVPCELGFRA